MLRHITIYLKLSWPQPQCPIRMLTKTPEALSAATATLSVDAKKRAEKDSQKKAAKASAAASREEERRAQSKVYIKRIERNKRKYVTAISGLELHGLDLKKVSKDLGKKFASGCSVTKTASATDEIILQGDLSDDVFDFILQKFPEVPEANIECIEDKKKKGAG